MQYPKYRVWDKKGKRMLPVDSLHWNIGQELKGIKCVLSEIEELSFNPKDVCLMQSIYLKDKNKREIYMDDLIRMECYDKIYMCENCSDSNSGFGCRQNPQHTDTDKWKRHESLDGIYKVERDSDNFLVAINIGGLTDYDGYLFDGELIESFFGKRMKYITEVVGNIYENPELISK